MIRYLSLLSLVTVAMSCQEHGKSNPPNTRNNPPKGCTSGCTPDAPVKTPAGPKVTQAVQNRLESVTVQFDQQVSSLTSITWTTNLGQSYYPFDTTLAADGLSAVITFPKRDVTASELKLTLGRIEGRSGSITNNAPAIPVDILGPRIVKTAIDSDKTLTLTYNEPIDWAATSQLLVNGVPSTQTVDICPNLLCLRVPAFSLILGAQESAQIIVSNLSDQFGNLTAQSKTHVSAEGDQSGPQVLQLRQLAKRRSGPSANEVWMDLSLSEFVETGKTIRYKLDDFPGESTATVIKHEGNHLVLQFNDSRFSHNNEHKLEFALRDAADHESAGTGTIKLDLKGVDLQYLPNQKLPNFCEMADIKAIRCAVTSLDVASVEITGPVFPESAYTVEPYQDEQQNKYVLLKFNAAVPEEIFREIHLYDAFGNPSDRNYFVGFTPVSKLPQLQQLGAATTKVLELNFAQKIGSIGKILVDGVAQPMTLTKFPFYYETNVRIDLRVADGQLPITAGLHKIKLIDVTREGNAKLILPELDLGEVDLGKPTAYISTVNMLGENKLATAAFELYMTHPAAQMEVYRQTKDELVLLNDVELINKDGFVTFRKKSSQGLVANSRKQTLVLKVDGRLSVPFEANWTTQNLEIRETFFQKGRLVLDTNGLLARPETLQITLERSGEERLTIPASWIAQKPDLIRGVIEIKNPDNVDFRSGSYILRIVKAETGPFHVDLPHPIELRFTL